MPWIGAAAHEARKAKSRPKAAEEIHKDAVVTTARASEVVANADAVVVVAVQTQVGAVDEGALRQGVLGFHHTVGVLLASPLVLGVAEQIQRQRKGAEGGRAADAETTANRLGLV